MLESPRGGRSTRQYKAVQRSTVQHIERALQHAPHIQQRATNVTVISVSITVSVSASVSGQSRRSAVLLLRAPGAERFGARDDVVRVVYFVLVQ